MNSFCEDKIMSDPQDLAISVVNNGSEDKVFRVLTGGTGLDEVVDNTSQGPLSLLSTVQSGLINSFSSGFSLIDESTNKAFFLIFTSLPNYALAVLDINSNAIIASISLSSYAGISSSSPMYLYNGYIYILSTSGSSKIILAINTTSYSIVSTTVPSAGALRFGDVDAVNGFLYFTSIGFPTLWKADLSNPGSTLPLNFIGLAGPATGDVTACKVGDTYIAVQGSPDLLFVDKSSFTYSSKKVGIYSGYGDIQFGHGNFAFAATDGITFINESILNVTNVPVATSAFFFSKSLKNQSLAYIVSASGDSVVSVDLLNESVSSFLVTGSSSLGNQPSYNSFTSCIVSADDSNLYSINSENTTTQEAVSVSPGKLSKTAIISSDTNGLMYGPAVQSVSGSTDNIYVFQKETQVPVSITYNGGITSSDYMQKSTISKPMKVLHMRIEASSFDQLSNLLQKIKKSSAGEVFNFSIQNLVKFDAASVQYVVDFDGSDLTDPIFDAIRYMQGTINANSWLNFHITYQEYSPQNIVEDNCMPLRWKDEMEPKKKVKHCVFKGRGFRQFI